MRQISINNKYITASIGNNIKFIFFAICLLSYFAWMDIALFVHLQRWSPPPLPPTGPNQTIITNPQLPQTQELEQFSTFRPLSVKLIMVDHVSHYIHDIVARYLEDTLHFTSVFPWVTANTVSFGGLFISLIGGRLIISERIEYMRLGAVLIELRNLGDCLDGVVYRSHQRKLVNAYNKLLDDTTQQHNTVTQPIKPLFYQSNHGTFGFKVDALCDGLGGTIVCIAILIKFLKHPPHKIKTSKLIITSISPENKNTQKGSYKYQQLTENEQCDPSSQNLIQMDDMLTQSSDTSSCEANDAIIITTNAATAFATANSMNPDYNYNNNINQDRNNARKYSSRQIKFFVVTFGIRLALTCVVWDHFVTSYHDLLMKFSDDPVKRNMQGQAFKSISTWLIMWFWRLGSACAILEHLSILAFFNKLWTYIYLTNYIGWAYLALMTFFTQIHYLGLYHSINGYVSPS